MICVKWLGTIATNPWMSGAGQKLTKTVAGEEATQSNWRPIFNSGGLSPRAELRLGRLGL